MVKVDLNAQIISWKYLNRAFWQHQNFPETFFEWEINDTWNVSYKLLRFWHPRACLSPLPARKKLILKGIPTRITNFASGVLLQHPPQQPASRWRVARDKQSWPHVLVSIRNYTPNYTCQHHFSLFTQPETFLWISWINCCHYLFAWNLLLKTKWNVWINHIQLHIFFFFSLS